MKKSNVYKNMNSNVPPIKKGANVQKQMNYYINNIFIPRLSKLGLFGYVNGVKGERDFNKIEKCANNYIKSIGINRENRLNDIIDNIDLTKSKMENVMTDTFYNNSMDKFVFYVRRMKIFDTKCEEYIQAYIIPILENEEKIVFDINSTDEDIKLKTENTLKIFSILVQEKGSLGAYINFGYIDFDDETSKQINFLYIDEDNVKKEIALNLCNDFITRYDKLDLTNVSNFNSYDFYLL